MPGGLPALSPDLPLSLTKERYLSQPHVNGNSNSNSNGNGSGSSATVKATNSLQPPPPKQSRPTLTTSMSTSADQALGSSTSSRSKKVPHPGTIKINVKGAFIVDDEHASAASPSHSPRLHPSRSSSSSSLSRDSSSETEHTCYHDNKDIRLPNQNSVVSHVAVDIGGSLAKLVYFSHEPFDGTVGHGGASQQQQQLLQGGRLNFLKFDTDKIEECIEFMRKLQLKHTSLTGRGGSDMVVQATGGGAFKFYDRIKDALGVQVHREDEMECLIIGLDFFIQEIPQEVFTHSASASPRACYMAPRTDIYPYLLVNIGSGVSMIKVSGPHQYQRIGGTSLGGGTLWGLLSLITGARSFDDMLAMADRGDNTAVDMLVGDIYGSGAGYHKIGLKSDTIASSFGKVYKMKRAAEREAEDGGGLANGDEEDEDDDDMYYESNEPLDEDAITDQLQPHHQQNGQQNSDNRPAFYPGRPSRLRRESSTRKFRPEDVSRSLLYAVSYNIGQIAYLQSTIHNLQHIYFGGSFIRGHRQTMNTLSYAITYWSKGEKQAYFLRHEGYLGAVGAFLKRQPRNWGRRNSADSVFTTAAFSSPSSSSSATATATTTATTTAAAATGRSTTNASVNA